MIVIEANKISKTYYSRLTRHQVQALNNVILVVNQGEIFGLLGPNGAGKTTLIKILLSIIFPTSGSAKVFGQSFTEHSWKFRAGYLPENHNFPAYLTGEQVLRFYGRLSGIKNDMHLNQKIKDLLELMKLSDFKKIKIKKYSKGMLQKLALAQALLSEPDLLFLDEPTEGVDPIGRKEIRDILLDLKSKGKTIFLNSHLLSEVEMICDRIAILNKGNLVKEGEVEELTRKENVYLIGTEDLIDENIKRKIITLDNNAGIGEYEIQTEVSIDNLNQIVDTLRKCKIRIKTIEEKKSTLEELFIDVIKQNNTV